MDSSTQNLESNSKWERDVNCTFAVFPGDNHHERLRDEDDELLQFALQQSLLESGSENDQVSTVSFILCDSDAWDSSSSWFI